MYYQERAQRLGVTIHLPPSQFKALLDTPNDLQHTLGILAQAQLQTNGPETLEAFADVNMAIEVIQTYMKSRALLKVR